MIKKEYYRLDELIKRFDVTFDDVRYWVESGSLNLAFHVSNRRFVIGGWQKNKGFIAFGISSYNGLVSIDENKLLELIKIGNIKCKNFKLLQKEKLALVDFIYPFKSSIPNVLLADWQPKSLDKIKWNTIPAKLCPSEQLNILKHAGLTIFNTLGSNEKSNADSKVDFSAYEKMSDYQFVFDEIEFDVNHSCVLHRDLERLGIVSMPEVKQVTHAAINKELPDESGDKSASRSSQLGELIERILHSNPKMKAIEVWRTLREETEVDSLDRKFDVEDILRDVTPNELLWQSRYGTNSSVKRSAFDSKVSRIRTKLGINKK
tara:strand:- start:2081 stop:3037 length:957 start_codon:yes stop_codon:yes gene_type:complete